MKYTEFIMKEIPKTKLFNYKNKRFSISYFGSQVRFYEEIKGLLPEGKVNRYIDLVAGGCGTPYQLLKDGRVDSVTTNDLSYYSYACAKTTFNPEKKYTLVELQTMLDAEPTSGYMTLHKEKNSKWWSDEQLAYLDGYCIKNKDNHIALAALGKTILSKYTFRGLGFARKTTNGIVLKEIPVEDIIRDIYTRLVEFNNLAVEVPNNNDTINGDANNMVNEYTNFKDAVVYADPAWPWHPNYGGDTGTGYEFLSIDLSSILKQQLLEFKLPWNISREKQIYDDVTLWISTALNKGAVQFVINSQDTNFPTMTDLDNHLRKTFNVVNKHTHVAFTSLAKRKNFQENWWVIKP
jgi:hypothetical protein